MTFIFVLYLESKYEVVETNEEGFAYQVTAEYVRCHVHRRNCASRRIRKPPGVAVAVAVSAALRHRRRTSLQPVAWRVARVWSVPLFPDPNCRYHERLPMNTMVAEETANAAVVVAAAADAGKIQLSIRGCTSVVTWEYTGQSAMSAA